MVAQGFTRNRCTQKRCLHAYLSVLIWTEEMRKLLLTAYHETGWKWQLSGRLFPDKNLITPLKLLPFALLGVLSVNIMCGFPFWYSLVLLANQTCPDSSTLWARAEIRQQRRTFTDKGPSNDTVAILAVCTVLTSEVMQFVSTY